MALLRALRRCLTPVLSVMFVTAMLVVPALAAGAGTLPDNLGDREKGAYVPTDCTQNDCAPGIRAVLTSSAGVTQSYGLTNQTVLTGFSDVMFGRQYAPALTGVSATLQDWGGSVGAVMYGTNGTTLDAAKTGAFTASTTPTGVLDALPLGIYNTSLPTLTAAQYAAFALDVNGRQLVVASGDVASGVTDSGSPVKAGGKYNATPPSLTDGWRADLQLGSKGSLNVQLMAPNSTTTISTGVASNVATSGSYINNLPVGQYNATPPVVTDTRYNNLQINKNGALKTETRTAPTDTALNTYAVRVTTNTTTTPTAATAYVSSIVITSEVAGTTSTVTIQDKGGTAKVLVDGLVTTAINTTPTVINFTTPILMTSGIDVVTAGAVAATVDIWINYYQ